MKDKKNSILLFLLLFSFIVLLYQHAKDSNTRIKKCEDTYTSPLEIQACSRGWGKVK